MKITIDLNELDSDKIVCWNSRPLLRRIDNENTAELDVAVLVNMLTAVTQNWINDQLKLKSLDELMAETKRPQPLTNPNFLRVVEMCKEYLELVEKDGAIDSDLKHYIFEGAIEACYGKGVWSWISRKTK